MPRHFPCQPGQSPLPDPDPRLAPEGRNIDELYRLPVLALAGLAAGAVNALAGGGTLITFPAMVALGVPPVVANLTSAVALCPGYLGGTLAQRRDLAGQGLRAVLLAPAAALGAVTGAFLLLGSSGRQFTAVVPGLIVLACALLAAQPVVRRWALRNGEGDALRTPLWAVLPVGLSAVYGGYFGAGLGVMTLAVLALSVGDTLNRLNAMKQLLSLVINVAAAVVFIRSGQVMWSIAAAVGGGALVGGSLGGRFAGRVSPDRLRILVITLGVAVAGLLWVRSC